MVTVQVIPLVEYAAVVVGPDAIATNFPFPKITELHCSEDGRVAVFHVNPSVEYAAPVVASTFPSPDLIATYVLFPYAAFCH